MVNERATIICILKILQECSDEKHIMPMREILLKLRVIYDIEVDRRTVYSAIELLIDLKYNISVYKQNHKGYFLKERIFTLPEIRLIMDSLYNFQGITSNHTKILVSKLQSTLSIYERRKYKNLIGIQSQMKTQNNQDFINIELIDNAISEKCKIRFTYLEYGFDKRLKPRRAEKYLVNPYGLICANEHYYLVCNYDAYDDISHYRIDRICDIELTSERIKPIVKGFDIRDFSRKSIYMFSGEEEAISIRCDNHILNDVLDKFGLDVIVTPNSDGTFTARFKALTRGMKFWALQYLPYCEVLEPDWLRGEIIESIGLNKYNLNNPSAK